MSGKNNFFLFQMNQSFNNTADEIAGASVQFGDLQPTQNPTVSEHIKQSNVKKIKKSIDEKTCSNKNSPLRKGAEKMESCRLPDFDTNSKSKTVKNLIEQVKNTLKSVERVHTPIQFSAPDVFSTANHSLWQNSILDLTQTDSEFLRQCPERASTGKIKNNDHVVPSHSKSGAKSVTTLINLNESEKEFTCGDKFNTTKIFFLGSEKNLNEAHKKAFKAAGGKILYKKDSNAIQFSKENLNKPSSNLRIRVGKSPIGTDSSNEYETDTGIPKSPTLFISGVSISRTPEPCAPVIIREKKSPDHKNPRFSFTSKNSSHFQNKNNSSPILNLIPSSVDTENEIRNRDNLSIVHGSLIVENSTSETFSNLGRQSRSSSLTVDLQKEYENQNIMNNFGLSKYFEKKSTNSKSNQMAASSSPKNSKSKSAPSNTVADSNTLEHDQGVLDFLGFITKTSKPIQEQTAKPFIFFQNSVQTSETVGTIDSGNNNLENVNNVSTDNSKKGGKSKSASEPEREREVFRFPKSSTDGALSSVLHVQESNLSSDDFHEVLFLLERSPKHGSKRKKKSKKERDKVKENLSKDECTEVSSAL